MDYKEFNVDDFELFLVYRIINCMCEDFSFLFVDDVENFIGFVKGELLVIDG